MLNFGGGPSCSSRSAAACALDSSAPTRRLAAGWSLPVAAAGWPAATAAQWLGATTSAATPARTMTEQRRPHRRNRPGATSALCVGERALDVLLVICAAELLDPFAEATSLFVGDGLRLAVAEVA